MQSHVTNLLFMGDISFYLDESMKQKWKSMINLQVGLLFYLYAVVFFRIRWPTSGEDLMNEVVYSVVTLSRVKENVTGSSPK